MQKIIRLVSVNEGRRLSVEEAWDRFVAAKKLSEETLSVEDGIKAGIAYREFCELFTRKAS